MCRTQYNEVLLQYFNAEIANGDNAVEELDVEHPPVQPVQVRNQIENIAQLRVVDLAPAREQQRNNTPHRIRRHRQLPHYLRYEYYEYPYVRPIGRVRRRLPATRMVYNVLSCVICGRTYQTNDWPTLRTNDFICSLDCFRRRPAHAE